jgi:hypothetical protein
MSASYRKINYVLRPAKSVERKMLCEAFRCLSSFKSIEEYQYIGFGSTYFSDFYLFHKNLNLSVMYSIERDTSSKERFEFNRPFKCVKIYFGESNDILPTLDWIKIPSIVWLDYDGKLNEEVISDINTVFSSAISGSLILISVNAKPSSPGDRLKELIRNVGENRIPLDTEEKHLSKWGTALILREIINNEIEETLVKRNGGIDQSEKIIYNQLFNFHYKDDAEMLTLGGVIHKDIHEYKFLNCTFSQLGFVRRSHDPYLITVPNLTYRELRFLDTHLPIEDSSSLKLPGVPSSDIDAYSRIYRYFPLFAEAEL